MCAHSKVDENKNSIQMACDASDIYLPFCNISNHELIELHGFCLEIIKCIEKRTHWPAVQKYHKKKEDCRLIPVLYVEKKVKTKNDKKMLQIGRRRSTGSPEWREWLVARESILLNEGERGTEGENFYRNKRGETGEIIYSEEESTAPSSLSSSTSSTYSSSSCASDSEGEEGFHPGRFGLEDGEMRSFQLDDEDYPDTVRVGGEEEEKEGENKEDLEGEKNFLPSYSSSTPPPPPSPTPIILPASLRLSPILRSRRSSLPQI